MPVEDCVGRMRKMELCPKCGCLSYFNSYFQEMMCKTCGHMWKEEGNMANFKFEVRITDLETFKRIVVENEILKLRLEKVLDAIDEGVPCPNVVDLPVTTKCGSANCKECWRQALESVVLDSIDPHPDGPLSSPEITEMHKDGTLCERCGGDQG